MVAESDIELVVAAARPIPPAVGVYIEDDFVMNLLETVIDYQQHTTTVVKALQHFRDHRWAEVRTLEDLERLAAGYPDDQAGNTELAEWLWGYRLWTRAQQLRGLTGYFRSVGVTDQEQLRAWAVSSTFQGGFAGRVKGLGPAVYQWLVMRLGMDTVKPDVHIRRFAETAVGRPLTDADVVEVVCAAAEKLGVRAFELDWRIWEASRAGTLSMPN